MAAAGIRLEGNTLAEGAVQSCAPLLNSSYSLWLACTYGPTSKKAIGFAADGAEAARYRPETWNGTVMPECAAYDDELARLVCQNEIYDAFSVPSVLMDNSTLLSSALDLSFAEVLASATPRAVAASAIRMDAIRALRANLARLAEITKISAHERVGASTNRAAVTGEHELLRRLKVKLAH